MANISAVKEITDKLEAGMSELFESEKYAAYLQTMSRFHRYSTRNTLLIHMQRPSATRVAGYNDWKNNFKRQVKKGEKGIRILAPIPFVKRQEMEKIDPDTQRPIIGSDGQPVREEVEIRLARFKVVPVFDVEQTEGEPLPELAETLTGDVARYELFMDALRAVSPLPIVFEELPPDNDGYCRFGEKIAIRSGMSEVQTVAAVIHEITHAKLHDQASLAEGEKPKDRRTQEVEAESVAFCVSNYYGIDTSANSLGYVAEWSRGRELKELNASLDTIRKTANELITGIDEHHQALAKERGIDLTAPVVDMNQMRIENPAMTLDEILSDREAMIRRIMEYIVADDPDFPRKGLDSIESNMRRKDIEALREDYFFCFPPDEPTRDPIRERLATLSQLEPLDEKYQLAFDTLVDALCGNGQLLALADTGAGWQRGVGQNAVYNNGHYETLIGNYAAELADLLADDKLTVKLHNTVKGEAYHRLDGIAYDRYMLDEYAEIAKSGRLDIYEKPGENNTVTVYLTEQLPDGGAHDYGAIFIYDPDDRRNNPINSFFSPKAWNELRESVFGRTESAVTLAYKETEPVGSTVLRRLLFTNGNFNREGKRTRVDVLPSMGKYSVYAQHLPGVIGDDTLVHVGTDSGYLISLGVDRTHFERDYFEAQIDRTFEKAGAQFDAMLADPTRFAMYQQAAIVNRIAEAEVHNVPVRELRDQEYAQERAELERQEQERELALQQKYDGRVDEIAKAIETGATISVGYEEYEYGGKNPVLDLFKLYDITLPLRTQGWVNTGLAEITDGSYRYYKSKHKGDSSTFGGYLLKLREAIRETPIEQKRGVNLPANEPEVKDSMEHALYSKLTELFPDFMSGKYSYMRLESNGFEPLSLEWIDTDRLSIMHTYTMNGDLMYDPMVTFDIDRTAQTLSAREFEQSMPPLYQRVGENGDGQSIDGNGNEHTIRGLQGKIHDFARQWFQSIGEQGYMPVKANLVLGEDEGVRISFDAEGNPIMLEQEYQLSFDVEGDGISVWNSVDLQPDGKYRELAFITTDREYKLLVDNLPDSVKAEIQKIALNVDFDVLFAESKQWAGYYADTSKPPTTIDPTLPDITITANMMYTYGYTQEDMHPLSAERAVELFNAGETVYLLYPDSTEALALDSDEILAFSGDGLCGITHADWIVSPIYAAQMAEAASAEASREADLLFGGEDKYGIYQLKRGDELHYHRFESMENLQKFGLKVERDNYELVYTAPLTGADTLDRLYERFNTKPPENFWGHSLAVSDIIVMQQDGAVSSHYVDRFGFAELPAFLGEERQQVPALEPSAPAYSQLGNSQDAPTVAELEAEVKAGRSISLMDLAQATRAEGHPSVSKGKPSLLGKLAENKQRAAQQGQAEPRRPNELEV